MTGYRDLPIMGCQSARVALTGSRLSLQTAQLFLSNHNNTHYTINKIMLIGTTAIVDKTAHVSGFCWLDFLPLRLSCFWIPL
jgi:hypothetical protein